MACSRDFAEKDLCSRMFVNIISGADFAGANNYTRHRVACHKAGVLVVKGPVNVGLIAVHLRLPTGTLARNATGTWH